MDSGLYVVATPIGNLADISQRAIDVLRYADLIAAEDTRHSQRLLKQHGIDTPMLPYHDHSDQRPVRKIDQCLARGGSVALVSDAGTPLISDPGYRLVRHVQDQAYPVYPIPGACAAVAALSASGLPSDRFLFEGFLPSREEGRRKRLEQLERESATLIFYEAPHRVLDSLRAMLGVFGEAREAVLARELSKTFETIRRAALVDLVEFVAADPQQQRGEIVLLVAGRSKKADDLTPETEALLQRIAQELPAKRAAAVVADLTGLRKKVLYDYLLTRREA